MFTSSKQNFTVYTAPDCMTLAFNEAGVLCVSPAFGEANEAGAVIGTGDEIYEL